MVTKQFYQSELMKVVLSRKSMDAAYGGLPSPVFTMDDGSQQFFPLPIPFAREYSGIHYNDIVLFKNYTAWKFIQDVAPGYKQSEYCHLDPDLKRNYLATRNAGWKPAFGQLSASQSHLANNGIGVGDVFLFFGWFQFAAMISGKAKYIVNKDYPNGFHAMYGYLQIGSICKPCSDEIPPPVFQHPHAQYINNDSTFNHPSNTIYIARNFFVYKKQNTSMPGAAIFKFDKNVVLTQAGQKQRTMWELPAVLHPENGIELSYNAAPFWKKENDKTVLSAYSRGQEFIFKKDALGNAEKWCAELILKNAIV